MGPIPFPANTAFAERSGNGVSSSGGGSRRAKPEPGSCLTKDEYAVGLQERLHDVVGRLHGRAYHPLPSRRQMIPKANGKLRPLGIPTLEDTLVQRGVVKVLERIYEEEFHSFWYGFRPGPQQPL